MTEVKMILTNSFKADIRVLKEAKTLVENGYAVEVLCWDRENELIDKEFEILDDIKIKRFYPYAKYGSGKKQIFAFLKFILEVKNYLKDKKYNILHAHDLDGLITGYLCKGKGQKLVYDSHEFFAGYKGFKIDKRIVALEKLLLKKVDKLISVSKSICDQFEKLYSLDKKDIFLIRNVPYYFQIDEKKKLFHEEFKLSFDKKIILYQGGIFKNRGIDNVLEIMMKLPEDIIFVIMGRGAYEGEVRKLIKELNLEKRVYIKGFVENKDLINWTNSADLGLSFIAKSSLSYYYCLPNKVMEFVQGEIPILASGFPDMKKFIEKNKIGKTCNETDIEKVAEEVLSLLYNKEKYSVNLKRAKLTHNWENESKKLIGLYSELEELSIS